MILPSIYLFLLTFTATGDYEEHYIGKIRNCAIANKIMLSKRHLKNQKSCCRYFKTLCKERKIKGLHLPKRWSLAR